MTPSLEQQTFSEIMARGWQMTAGSKTPLLLAGLIYFGVTTALQMPAEFAARAADTSNATGASWIFITSALSLVGSVIGLPMMAGWLMMGVKRVREQPLTPGQIWQYLPKTLSCLLLMIVTMLIYGSLLGVAIALYAFLGTFVGTVFGITALALFCYLSVCLSFGIQLVVDRDLGPIEALLASRAAVHSYWWKIAAIQAAFGLMLLAGVFTLCIAWIWLLPWFAITWGDLYCELFDEKGAALPDADINDHFTSIDSRYSQKF